MRVDYDEQPCMLNLPTLKAVLLETLLLTYTPEWSWPSCLTLLLTTDVTSHILQGLTVTPFKFHLPVPQAISTLSFVKPPGYGMNYRLRLSHVHLLPLLREHVCFFTLNNTYTSLLCFSSCFFCFFWGGGGGEGVHDLY